MEKQEPANTDWMTASRRRQRRINALICAACAAAMIVPIAFKDVDLILERMELKLGDWLTRDRGGGEAHEEMVLIGIDDASLDVLDVLDEEAVLAQPQLDAMSYGYPFPRSVYAALSQKLLDAGARLLVFDMLFTGEGEGDAEFKAVIDANPGKIVVGCNYVVDEIAETNTIASRAKFALPSETVVQSDDPLDPRIGFVNFFPDADVRVRSLRPMMRIYAHESDPPRHSLALAALKQLGKGNLIENPFAVHHARFPEMVIGGEETYPPLPFYSLFVEHDWEKNYRGGEVFRDKIVYIGGSSVVGFHDDLLIPEGNVLGVQLQMGVLAAMLDGDFYEVFSKKLHISSVVLMAVIVFGVAFFMRRPFIGFLVLVTVGGIYWLVVSKVYTHLDHLLPSAAPTLTLLLAGIGCFSSQFTLEVLEKARFRRTLERQVSKELADHILSVPEGYFQSLPGVRKPVTVLFSDIRSFTARSEKDDPVELVKQLKEYLDEMTKIVFEHGGVVDKFIGDAVMAVWGNLRSEGPRSDTRNAVTAAIEMLSRLEILNAKWEAAGRQPFKIGIGLNHGEVIFGMMGSEQKQEWTVIGDPVNQAARLESLTKKFAQGIIIGPQVAKFLDDGQFTLRSLGKVRTMGKEEAEELSGVLGADLDVDWLERYHEALATFQAGELEKAREQFERCREDSPDDPACAMYLEAIAQGESSGVLVMTGK